MNILLYEKKQRNGELISIRQTEKIKHLTEILKLNTGDTFRVGEINGLMGLADIQSISEHEITFTVNLTLQSPPPLPCTVIIALPRPQQLKRILLHLSSLGVKKIHLIQSARVEKNYWQSPTLAHIEDYLVEGLEQAQDTVLPTIEMHKHWPTFVEKYLPLLIKNKHAWLAQPGNFPYCPSTPEGKQVILIGPEGGFIEEEVKQLQAVGCKTVSLGKRILKVETAIPVLISKLFELK